MIRMSKLLLSGSAAVFGLTMAGLSTSARADPTVECNANAGPDGIPGNADGPFGTTECGVGARAPGPSSTATGYESLAYSANSTSTGANSLSAGDNSTATGESSQAVGNNTTAMGQDSKALDVNSTSLGQGSLAEGESATAVGQDSWAGGHKRYYDTGDFMMTSQFYNARTTALGAKAQAGAAIAGQTDATAVGYGAQANALNASAFGANSSATATNAVALGQGSVADRDDSVSVGGGLDGNGAVIRRQITNVAAGTEATDAVNKAQLDVVEAKADAAQVTANSALTAAGAATGSATAAQATADAAVAKAPAAQTPPKTPPTPGAGAQTTANTPRAEAAGAQTTANTAIIRGDALGASAAAALGGGSTYDSATGTVSAPSYSIGEQSFDNVGSAFAAVDDELSQFDTRLDALASTSDRRFRQANGGIAMALALGGTMVVPESHVSVDFNLATYRGEQGFSGAVVMRAAPRVYISGGFAGSTVKGSTGGRVGVAFGF